MVHETRKSTASAGRENIVTWAGQGWFNTEISLDSAVLPKNVVGWHVMPYSSGMFEYIRRQSDPAGVTRTPHRLRAEG